jgi:RimJ/RimL family protein N-acetyltransferase
MEPVHLTTDRLLLRPLRDADIDAVLAAGSDPATQHNTTIPVPYTREHARSFVQDYAPGAWRDEKEFVFGVALKPTDELVACVSVHARNFRDDGVAEIGYWAVPAQRGHGYTAEAVGEICRWAFAELGVVRMEWQAVEGNWPSRRVAEKAGFAFEGTLRSKLVHRGRRFDGWIGARLAPGAEATVTAASSDPAAAGSPGALGAPGESADLPPDAGSAPRA